MNIEPFIITNAINTCYIDSLLMALFFTPSILESILNNDVSSSDTMYLQEYIRVHFVERVRNNKSVNEDIMNLIRILCVQIGWRSEVIRNDDEFFGQQDVNEFYTFLMNKFDGPFIDIQRITIIEGVDNIDNSDVIEKLPFIPVNITGHTNITVKDILNDWMNNNYTTLKKQIDRSNDTEMNGINYYKIINEPIILPIAINRFNKDGDRENTKLTIQKKISPVTSVNPYYKIEWDFHSAICHTGSNFKEGHYYTLLNHYNQYYIFDDLKVPCIEKIDMSDPDIIDKIKLESVFLIYKRVN